MPKTGQQETQTPSARQPQGTPPDRIILVYDANSGIGAMLLDVVKKAVGREECALCEITYSPLGKRGAWRACETRLGVAVEELHRDQIPEEWGIARAALPCILAGAGAQTPFILLSKREIESCHKSVEALEKAIVAALARAGRGRR